jgi:ABC-type spermidine/putrescine transport system permease subunit I
MRAICGAIITAGALIGLGLTAIGFGLRFQNFGLIPSDETAKGVFYATPSLMICLVTTVAATVVGLAVAFLGLAFHHERRYREVHGEVGHPAEGRTPVGTSRVSV